MTSDQRDHQHHIQTKSNPQDESPKLHQASDHEKLIYPGIKFKAGQIEAHFKASQFLILSVLGKAHRRGILSQGGLFELRMARKKIVVHLQYELPQLICELTKKDPKAKNSLKDDLERYHLKLVTYLRFLDKITHPKFRHTIQANHISPSVTDLIRHLKTNFNQLKY